MSRAGTFQFKVQETTSLSDKLTAERQKVREIIYIFGKNHFKTFILTVGITKIKMPIVQLARIMGEALKGESITTRNQDNL